MKLFFTLYLLLIFKTQFGQEDSVYIKKHITPYIAPTTLILGGTFIHFTDGKLGRFSLQNRILTKYPNSKTHLDDYLPFIPIAQMYLGNHIGLKSKNNFLTMSKQLFISQLFTSIITHTLKQTTLVTRPDNTPFSFPSGHTSMAFASASTLFYEYKDNNLLYAYSGFIFSSTTGSLRVLNNRHWVSDVLVGAGIAILTTHIIYKINPLKNWNIFKNKKMQ